MAFIVSEFGSESDDGPTVTTILNVFGPFNTEEDSIKWAKAEVVKRWQNAPLSPEWARYAEDEVDELTLPLLPMYEETNDFWYERCWFSVTELTSPDAA